MIKHFFLAGLLGGVFILTLAADGFAQQAGASQPDTQNLVQGCTKMHDDGSLGSFRQDYVAGDQTVAFYNPVGCSYEGYPYEVTGVRFSLNGWGEAHWPVTLDIVLYDKGLGAHQCGGPGDELCRYAVVCEQATWEYPAIGLFTFPQPCCLPGPFFIGLEYREGMPPYPSLVFDGTATTVKCDVWQYSAGMASWQEWRRSWGADSVGYPILRADVRRNPSGCGEWLPRKGDFNGDGVINISDCVTWMSWKYAGGWIAAGGDMNGDCIIDEDDYPAFCFLMPFNAPPPAYTCLHPYIACTCIPGDADNNKAVNISDAVFIITYMFSGGSAPGACVGDPNDDCVTNISDAVFLIARIFSGGVAPCSCLDWAFDCYYQQP